MSDGFDSVQNKVLGIFQKLVGERAKRLDGGVIAAPAMNAITVAMTEEHEIEKASDIAFHMSDWNSDAAFMVAVHLFPEQFTAEEIDCGIAMFLDHAPSHIREACQLTGRSNWVDF